MSLPTLAMDSAVGSRVNSSVAHPGTAWQWYSVLHHQRASNGMSTSSKLGQLLAYRGDVLPIYRLSKFRSSLVPRPHPARISLSRAILKAIRAGVGFGSGTETSSEVAKMFHLLTWVCARAGFD